MSSYNRNYVPWNKSSNSSTSYSSSTGKKETTSTASKYDSSYGKKKNDDEKSATTRIASKYGTLGSSYQRDSGVSGTYSNRLKPSVEKKDVSHPPVSYRGLARTTPRSRDPSPDKSSTSTSYNYNRLYPTRPYTRSTSRELEVPSTIPKYTGRSSTNKDDSLSRRSSISREDLTSVASKYGGRSSISKDDVPRYGGRSSTNKDDLVPKYAGRSSLNKDDLVPKYGGRSSLNKDDLLKYTPSSRATSREDLSLSSGSQKYINSRFLPKNSIEKSYTAYTRPSTLRSHETLRKNRELLNSIHAQQEQERASRPTSRCSSVTPDDYGVKTPPPLPPQEEEPEVEMETVSTVTRGTSPSITTSNIARRRNDVSKTVEKNITRPKMRIGIDKEVQSDRLDDSTKTSRFSGASRISAAPWSSILDMKFSGPNDKSSSPKNISRTSSNKSLDKKSPPKTKSPPKQSLPPQIPKSESSKSSLHSITTTNKDFRKSVLNMSEANGKKKVGRRSASASSADSETDVQPSEVEKTSSSSKLPQKRSQRSRRSPSSDASTSSSSTSEEEKKSDLKVTSSRTSIASGDELSTEKGSKPPPSPRVKSEAEAKSFLMRALAPVTNFFKPKSQEDSESPPKSGKFLKRIESGERAWWLEEPPARPKTLLRKVESGELAWWLDKNADAPEGVQVHPTDTTIKIVRLEPENEPNTNIMDPEYQERHQIRHIDSGERSWWLNSSENIPEMVHAQESKSEKPKYAIRHQESGEKAWWLKSNSHIEDPEFDSTHAPLGDRASPEGVEMPKGDEGRLSPYDNVPVEETRKGRKPPNLFISRHTNIDEILGGCGSMWSPFEYRDKGGECMEVDAKEVRIHDSTAQKGVIQPSRI